MLKRDFFLYLWAFFENKYMHSQQRENSASIDIFIGRLLKRDFFVDLFANLKRCIIVENLILWRISFWMEEK